MFLVRLLSPFGTVYAQGACIPRQGNYVAVQLNSSLGCLLCGARRTSVAQSLPPEQSDFTNLNFCTGRLGGNSLAREYSLKPELFISGKIRMLAYPVIAAGNRSLRYHESRRSEACSREAQPAICHDRLITLALSTFLDMTLKVHSKSR